MDEGRRKKENMSVAGTRRLCRVGLIAVLVTALCVLTLLDSPPQLPDPPADPPPTPGKQFSPLPALLRLQQRATFALSLSLNGSQLLCHLTMPAFISSSSLSPLPLSLPLSLLPLSSYLRWLRGKRLDTAHLFSISFSFFFSSSFCYRIIRYTWVGADFSFSFAFSFAKEMLECIPSLVRERDTSKFSNFRRSKICFLSHRDHVQIDNSFSLNVANRFLYPAYLHIKKLQSIHDITRDSYSLYRLIFKKDLSERRKQF